MNSCVVQLDMISSLDLKACNNSLFAKSQLFNTKLVFGYHLFFEFTPRKIFIQKISTTASDFDFDS
jgi:hypothetical protein